MALGDGLVWDEANPQQSTLVNQGPLYETDFKVGVRKRLAQEHVWPSSQTDASSAGQHTYISLQGQTGAPAMPLVSGTVQPGMLYCLTNGALTFQNATGGTKTIITSSGSVNIIGASYSATGTTGELIIGTSGGTLTTLAPATGGGKFLISTTSALGVGWGGLGSWTTRSAETTYQATNDCFVMCAATGSGSFLVSQILSDSTTTPATARAQNQLTLSGGGVLTVMSPVRSGDYYTLHVQGGTLLYGYVLPLGV